MKDNLSYLFTSKCLQDLFSGELFKIKQCYKKCNIQNKDIVSVADFYDFGYKSLLKNYPNEYVFKNLITQKILIGKHSLKSSALFAELRILNSKVDVAIFNGTSYAYEIKTEFDNFNKLKKQLNNYKKVFEYINIVTVESKLKCLKKILQYDDNIGILILTNKRTLSTIKKAQSNLDNIDNSYLFSLLHKIEYLKIIKKHCGYVPNVPNMQIYDVCKELFINLPIETTFKETVNIMKQRKKIPI